MPNSNGSNRDEVLYTFRMVGSNLCIAKFDDTHKGPVSEELITQYGRGSCSCFGALRGATSGGCKHVKMVRKLLDQGFRLCGALYDYDRDILWYPEDGEAIPLTGVVDILALASEQQRIII